MRPRQTEHTVRETLLELVRGRPGIHLREAARELDVSVNLADYHLRVLEKAGRVMANEEGGRKGYFPTEAGPTDKVPLDRFGRKALMLLRDLRTLTIVIFLLVKGKARTGEVATEAGISASTASHHLKRLTREGLLTREEVAQTYTVADPPTIARIIVDYRPCDEGIIESFASLWDEMGEGL